MEEDKNQVVEAAKQAVKNKVKKEVRKKVLLWIGGLLAGPVGIFLGVFLLIVILVAAHESSLDHDTKIYDSGLGESYYQEISETMLDVQEKLNDEYNMNDLIFNGALIGSTLDSAVHFNPYLFSMRNSTKGLGYTLFPNEDLIYDMAEGMIVTKVTEFCTFEGLEGEVTDSYTISYINELIGVNGRVKPICDAERHFFIAPDMTKYEYITSDEYYTEVYLYDFYKLDEISKTQDWNAEDINYMVEKTIGTYEDYLYMLTGSSLHGGIGINYVITSPVISSDYKAALPLTIDLSQPYGAVTTDEYGWRIHPIHNVWSFHTGLDLACYQKNPDVYSVYPGVVVEVGTKTGLGNYVIVAHNNDGDDTYELRTLYAHFYRSNVSEGQSVMAGDILGICGSSGFSTGPHLHFETQHLKSDGTYDVYKPTDYPTPGDDRDNPVHELNKIVRIIAQSGS